MAIYEEENEGSLLINQKFFRFLILLFVLHIAYYCNLELESWNAWNEKNLKEGV